MTPPINIDGSDISGGTIDGTDFSEVTVDGTTVFSAIPDSGGTHQYNADEGSGTTLTDSIGSLDGSITGATYTSGSGAGGFHLDYDGTDDRVDLGSASRSEFRHFVEDGQGTFAAWINPDDVASDRVVFGGRFSSSETGAFLRIASNGSFTWLGTGSGVIWNFDAGSAVANEWQFIAGTADGSTAYIYHADSSNGYTLSQEGTASLSTGNLTASDWLSNAFIGADSRSTPSSPFDGGIDITFTDNVEQSQSSLQTFVDNSKGLY